MQSHREPEGTGRGEEGGGGGRRGEEGGGRREEGGRRREEGGRRGREEGGGGRRGEEGGRRGEGGGRRGGGVQSENNTKSQALSSNSFLSLLTMDPGSDASITLVRCDWFPDSVPNKPSIDL